MNVQAHLSGQVSNQLPPQQNGNQRMQNLAASANAPANMLIIDPELCRARNLIHQKIFEIIMRRHSQPVDDTQKQKFKGTAKRLEEGLFKAAQTKEDYLNLNTLESRLSSLLKRSSTKSHNQPTADERGSLAPSDVSNVSTISGYMTDEGQKQIRPIKGTDEPCAGMDTTCQDLELDTTFI
ncbi:histone acetyltransferase HAC1 [Populus alba x Populus x berolinensis]|uniref:Histone acetyltransferase HAC1 n=1 Tax=Populus alba x Populus x berolinensis TaxID=444605 RepID=A0AAD6W7V1_9ROSI|nr:histone acetyltransferase HAC1 [Populus alba x Populus x berolinensis]KAJ7002438.1 histone acetyltransferase HAC1 [Populus alba x Populus x berolinensis]